MFTFLFALSRTQQTIHWYLPQKTSSVGPNNKDFLNTNKAPHYKSFIKSIKENKTFIFHENHVPNKQMGPIHALVLQLLAKGIISVGVSDVSKIGSDKLNATHIVITLPNAIDSEGITMPAHMIEDLWDGLNYI